MKKTINGFTIVELLIVIVVIAILASISVVAYTGIQGRARDSKRRNDISQIARALELYKADNGGYPTCWGNKYQPGDSGDGGVVSSCLQPSLVPKYMASLPVDPVNVAPRVYYYAVGYRKSGVNTYDYPQTDNYILAATFDTPAGPLFTGWDIVVPTLNYLEGTSY